MMSISSLNVPLGHEHHYARQINPPSSQHYLRLVLD